MNTDTSPDVSQVLHAPPVESTSDKATIITFWLLPFLGLIGTIVFQIHEGTIDWFYPGLFLGCYLVAGFGTTVFYHRYFTHESFKALPIVELLGGIAGSMAGQGKIQVWCSTHGHHHQHSDQDDDPHSPWKYCIERHKISFGNLWLGFWHAQFGWMLQGIPLRNNAFYRRLSANPTVQFIDRHLVLWILLGFLLPTLFGYLHEHTWKGALLGFLWGGAVRMFIHQHTTSLVNSYCHLFGTRPFKSKDYSTDSWLIALLALGEGFHNGHHVFPNSPLHGIHYRYLDLSYLFIRLLELFGLAKDVKKKIPSPESVLRRQQVME
ncbi:MAG: acyl-CoA desaturase [bacterium]